MIELKIWEIEGEGECDTVTKSQHVHANRPKKIQRIYEHGMNLAEAMRKAGRVEEGNDLEIWVLGMVHELEELKGENK